jgi:hypothetical protein
MRGQPVLFRDFAGGVNRQAAPYALEPNEARDARNVVSTQAGAVRKRNGILTFAAPAAALHSLAALPNPAFLVGVAGNKIYSISPAAVITDITAALAVTPGQRWEFALAPASGQGPLFGMNGVDPPIAWSGAGNAVAWTATSGVLPNGKYLTVAANKVFVAGMAANPSRLAWCDIAAPRAWPAANVVDFDPEDGEELSGIGTIGPYVVVFKPSKTWIVYDLETGANRRIGDNAGCVAHRSIVETPVGTLFLSKDQGVMETNGQSVKRVSDRVKPELDAIAVGQRSLAAGAFIGGHYYLSIAQGGAANDLTLDYDLLTDSWWLHSLGTADFAVWEAGAAAPSLFGAKAAAAIVDKLFVAGIGQDNGANFVAYWKGAYLPFGIPAKRKRIRQARVDGSGTFDVLIGRDFSVGESFVKSVDFLAGASLFGGAGAFGGAGVFGDAQLVQQATAPSLGIGRAFSIVFRSQSPNPFEVESYTLAIAKRED